MKFGLRTPSLKKSISARTTGRAKRAIKKALIPGYGKKGMGWIKNPKKAAYHKGFYGCEEITIGFANKGLANEIVDFMAMDSKGIIC